MKKLLLFLAIIFSTHSHALEFQGKFLQGHFILGKAEAGSKVFVDKTQVKVLRMDILYLVLIEIENLM